MKGDGMSDFVSRTYDNATIIYDRENNQSIFFEGELANFAFQYFNNSKYEIPEDFFNLYNEEDKQEIIDDFNMIKKSIDAFSIQSKLDYNDITVNDEIAGTSNSMQELINYAQNNWQIINTSIELTSHCNLRCDMCYIDDYTQSGLSLEELEELACNLKNKGVLFISFTGGEIFTRKDILEIISMYYNFGFVIEIKTNALLLNREMIQYLAKMNIFDFQISIYEVNDSYSSYTKSNYNYFKLQENIKDLIKHNIPLTLSVLVGKHNIDKLNTIHESLTSLGTDKIFYSPYITPNRGNLDKKEAQYRLSYQELEEKFKPFVNSIDGFSEVKKYRNCNLSDTICYAGRDQIAISSNGNIYPCLDLNLLLGSIKDESFDEILEKRFSMLKPYKIQDIHQCIVCDIRDFCDSCIGIAFIENKSYQEPVPHKCDISRFYYSNMRRKSWQAKNHLKKLKFHQVERL